MIPRLRTPRTAGPRLATLLVGTLLAAVAHAAEAPLGRLFFTPEERRRIDAGVPALPPDRRAADPRRDADASAGGAPAPVRVDGVVRRAGGGTAVWVDGRALEGPERDDGLRVAATADPARVRIRRPGAAPAELRAGESEDRPGLGPGNRVEVVR